MKRTLLSAILAAMFAMAAQAQFVPSQKGYGPRDGTGYGAKANNQGKRPGGGTCDGTGPKGRQQGGRRGGSRQGGQRGGR